MTAPDSPDSRPTSPPAEPLWPDRPEQPSPPARPAPPPRPARTSQQAQPNQPGQPAQPGAQAQPGQPPQQPQPGQPLWPSQPSQPGQPGQPGVGAGLVARGGSPAWPAWSAIGPALGALLLTGVLGTTLGSDPDARRVFGLSVALLVVATAGYVVAALGGAAVGLFVGRRWPAPVAAPGMGVMLVGVLAVALSPNVTIMVLGQVLAGLGGGAAAGTAVGLLPRLGQWRLRATLVLAIGAAVALVIGLALGWGISMSMSWRLAFFLAVPGIVVAGAVTVAGGIVRLVARLSR